MSVQEAWQEIRLLGCLLGENVPVDEADCRWAVVEEDDGLYGPSVRQTEPTNFTEAAYSQAVLDDTPDPTFDRYDRLADRLAEEEPR